jgi:hypothetical protein
MDETRRTRIIHEQTLVVDFEPEAAILALPALLPAPQERTRALALIEDIAGDPAEMSEPTVKMLARLREILPVPADEKPKAPARAKPQAVPGK